MTVVHGRAWPTFARRWREAVDAAGDRPFLVFESVSGTVSTWTYRDFDAVVQRAAGFLSSRGVGRGDLVHMVLPNSPAFVAVWLACARLGAAFAPSDPRATAPELAEQRRRLRPVLAVCGEEQAIAYRAPDDASVGPVVVVGGDDAGLDVFASAPPVADGEEPSAGALLAVMFTSGTTSVPKGVELTQANYAFAGDVMAAGAALGPPDRYLVVLPLFHANAQYYSFAPAISVGASVALMSAFSATGFLEQAERHGVTHASLFAAPMRMVLARGRRVGAGVRLRHVWFAQNLSPDEFDAFGSLVGCRPRQLYGMTETLPAVLMSPPLAPVARSMGQVALGCHVRVCELESNQTVAPGAVGELQVGGWPGLSLFRGYLDDPGATEAAIAERRADGFLWFRTGDRATTDEDGNHYFAGRGTDVLKVAGENVSLVEVEATIALHPDVFDVAVVGQPDPVRDEVPVAYVVAQDGTGSDLAAAVERWCADRLAPAKRPRAVYVVAELPRTSVGKVRKFLLPTLIPTQGERR